MLLHKSLLLKLYLCVGSLSIKFEITFALVWLSQYFCLLSAPDVASNDPFYIVCSTFKTRHLLRKDNNMFSTKYTVNSVQLVFKYNYQINLSLIVRSSCQQPCVQVSARFRRISIQNVAKNFNFNFSDPFSAKYKSFIKNSRMNVLLLIW